MPSPIHSDIVVRNTTSEIVIEKILAWIKEGKLHPGDRLPPANELAEAFGVGRSSVREALRGLALLNCIDIFPGKGTFVRQDFIRENIMARDLLNVISSGPIFDIMEVRDWLEPKCAEAAAQRAGWQQISKMEEALEIMIDPNSSNEALSKADLRFHLALAESANNDLAYEIMKLLISKMEFFADNFGQPYRRPKKKFMWCSIRSFPISKKEGAMKQQKESVCS